MSNKQSMNKMLEDLHGELEAASGKRVCDTILYNVRIVDVYSERITDGSVAIYNGHIVAINPGEHIEARNRLDGHGWFAVPGFIDSHVHVETILLTPEALGDLIVPWGTTSMFVDAMEIANVAGLEGLNALMNSSENLPFRMYLEIPSRVPTMPGFETTGGTLEASEVEELLESDAVISLGELDPSKVLDIRDSYLRKILCTLSNRRICNGHAIGLCPQELNIYATGHLADDHECVSSDDLINRLKVGIGVMLREGSSERNTAELVRCILANNLPTDSLMFCTDDKHANDIAREGHISYNVQLAINLGLPAITAIKMASLNAARHFHMEHELGSITPGRFADIILLPSLEKIVPAMVMKGGEVVFDGERKISAVEVHYPDSLMKTVKLPKHISADSFRITASGSQALCRVIGMIPNQIVNEEHKLWMRISDGEIKPDLQRDILKLAVVERYGKTNNVKAAFVQGFGLKKGALASSVSHDHHNIVVVGCDDNDMLLAVRELEKMQGGFVAVAEGKVLGVMPLPLAGLMSIKPADVVMKGMDELNETVAKLGCSMKAPFMSLSFISLPTVPELGLTDMGMVDVLGHCFIDSVVETK